MLNTDGDLGRHITIGNYILDQRTIPTRDIFSHTMTGKQLVPHEWLAELIFSGVNRLAGLNGIVLLVSFIITTTFHITYQTTVKQGIFRIIAIATTILAAFTSNLHWLARPHVFTFLFSAIWTFQLNEKSSKTWLFPLIMLIWANTHGAFIIGFAIWIAYFTSWIFEFVRKQETITAGKRLLFIGLSSLAVTMINPSGWHLWDTSIGYFGSRFLVDKTLEYQSPDFHIANTWPFLVMLVLFLAANGFGKRLKMYEIFLLAGWGVLSLYSARNIPIFAIVNAPTLGKLYQGIAENIPLVMSIEEKLAAIEKRLRGYWFNAIAIIVLVTTTLHASVYRFNERVFPVDAVNWLIENPQDGHMFNFFTWGGYLLFRLWPEQQVFIDGQTDFYGESLSREYVHVESVQAGWEEILNKYKIDWVIIQPNQPLANSLVKFGWTSIYKDDITIILRAPND